LQSIGLALIRNKELLLGTYWDGDRDSSLSDFFAVAKSITGMLTGAGICDRYIGSVNEPPGKYLSSFTEGEKSKATIKDLPEVYRRVCCAESLTDRRINKR